MRILRILLQLTFSGINITANYAAHSALTSKWSVDTFAHAFRELAGIVDGSTYLNWAAQIRNRTPGRVPERRLGLGGLVWAGQGSFLECSRFPPETASQAVRASRETEGSASRPAL